MQPPSVVMKSKARILIDVSDVLFKTVLTHRVAPSDATLITFKILEVCKLLFLKELLSVLP